MATKDLVYLGLIALSGIVFYLHGFQAGFSRSKEMFHRFFDNSGALAELPPPEQPPPAHASEVFVMRGTRAFFSPPTIRGVFGNN